MKEEKYNKINDSMIKSKKEDLNINVQDEIIPKNPNLLSEEKDNPINLKEKKK